MKSKFFTFLITIIMLSFTVPNVHAETSDKITNLSEIQVLLEDYVKAEELPASVAITDYSMVQVLFQWGDYTLDESVIQYVDEKNIDENLIEYIYLDYPVPILGDADENRVVNVRDCAFIASKCAKNEAESLSKYYADFNEDGSVNVRDAAAIASDLAKR